MIEIFISDLKIPVRIGCVPGEKEHPQSLRFDLRVGIKNTQAAKSGLLDHTVCYKRVSEEISALALQNEWNLLEQLADSITSMIFENFPASAKITLRISKFTVPGAESVGIEVSEER